MFCVNRRYLIGLSVVLLVSVSLGGVFLSDSGQTSPYTLQVSEAETTGSDDEAIVFLNLTEGQQRVFKNALQDEGCPKLASIPSDVNEEVFSEMTSFVTYQNQPY